MIGHPSERDFKSMVSNNMMQNFPITASAVTNAHTTFGNNLAGTRGNTVRQNLDRVVMDYVAVPRVFLKLHKFVTVVTDLMLVKNVVFLISMYCGIKSATIEHMTTRTAKKLSKY